MNPVDTLNSFPLVLSRMQLVMDVDAPDHQDVSVKLDLTSDLGGEFAVAGVNLTRFQRAGEDPLSTPPHRALRLCAQPEDPPGLWLQAAPPPRPRRDAVCPG